MYVLINDIYIFAFPKRNFRSRLAERVAKSYIKRYADPEKLLQWNFVLTTQSKI